MADWHHTLSSGTATKVSAPSFLQTAALYLFLAIGSIFGGIDPDVSYILALYIHGHLGVHSPMVPGETAVTFEPLRRRRCLRTQPVRRYTQSMVPDHRVRFQDEMSVEGPVSVYQEPQLSEHFHRDHDRRPTRSSSGVEPPNPRTRADERINHATVPDDGVLHNGDSLCACGHHHARQEPPAMTRSPTAQYYHVAVPPRAMAPPTGGYSVPPYYSVAFPQGYGVDAGSLGMPPPTGHRVPQYYQVAVPPPAMGPHFSGYPVPHYYPVAAPQGDAIHASAGYHGHSAPQHGIDVDAAHIHPVGTGGPDGAHADHHHGHPGAQAASQGHLSSLAASNHEQPSDSPFTGPSNPGREQAGSIGPRSPRTSPRNPSRDPRVDHPDDESLGRDAGSTSQKVWFLDARTSVLVNGQDITALRFIADTNVGCVIETKHSSFGVTATKILSKAKHQGYHREALVVEHVALRMISRTTIIDTHLVPLLQSWEDEHSVYFVMPLYQCTLKEHLEIVGHLHLNLDVKGFAAQLASALQSLSQLGIVHHDIKLENIFMDDSEMGTLFLGGFDSCYVKPLSDAPPDDGRIIIRRLRGTAGYLSPEKLFQDPVELVDSHLDDASVDMWSLGIVYWQLMADSATSRAALMQKLVAIEAENHSKAQPTHKPGPRYILRMRNMIEESKLTAAQRIILHDMLCVDSTERLKVNDLMMRTEYLGNVELALTRRQPPWTLPQPNLRVGLEQAPSYPDSMLTGDEFGHRFISDYLRAD
ncbi:hypothetical protein EUX98_g6582 [Antrodiella citrinella]|uniref:Protein kinase domain-containing protein n=1 Tax=Antrodiella citrinella TaxID=2447956 RepID=A0A4S4MQP9_9APHY|nr:hypothetical protein EUX98_g6582 [Antrodiella citrinella]